MTSGRRPAITRPGRGAPTAGSWNRMVAEVEHVSLDIGFDQVHGG